MLNTKQVLMAAAAVSFVVLSGSASADRGYHHHRGGRVHFGLTLGVPLWYPGPYYYHPPPVYGYPSYPPAVVVRPAPTVYVEREDQVALDPVPPARIQYWYFCRDADAYYPYVKECPSPWERVPARPATP